MASGRRSLDQCAANMIRNSRLWTRWPPYRPRKCFVSTIVLLCIIILVTHFGRWVDKLSSRSEVAYELRNGSHPVEHLHAAAEKQFDTLLARQSSTFEEAIVEYKRRYRRVPPPGFERWFAFAKQHTSLIIDDYDAMMRSLEPFWKIDPTDVVSLMERADSPEQTHAYIKKCSVAKGRLNDCGAWTGVMSRHLGKALQSIPDMFFLASYMDEPSVLAPGSLGPESDGKFGWSEMARKPIWPQMQRICTQMGVSPEETMADSPLMVEELHFVTNVTHETNICAYPELKDIHGYLVSAVSSLHLYQNVPILSRAVPESFGDILFPAPSYSWSQFSYISWRDWSWKSKYDALYWAGSNTGSYTYDETWRNHHRQRLVLLGMGADEGKEFNYLRKAVTEDYWIPYRAAYFDKSQYHVAMTKIRECEEPACTEQNDAFGPAKKPESASEPYHYKYVFDIDGNSLSGRLYRLLASNSAVLKTKIFREWHDERLVPWLHYIPVSLGFEELPELVKFLTQTFEGQEIGRRVAVAGQKWHGKALREVDRSIYFYRLLLEIGWLQNPGRVPG